MPEINSDALQKKTDRILAKLQEYYPDKVIRVSLQKEHKALGNRIGEVREALGFECVSDFLEAYGYTPEYAMKGSKYDGIGRPRTRNIEDVAEELKHRYEGRSFPASIRAMVKENPDLAGKLKTLSNSCKADYGKGLSELMKERGLLGDAPKKAFAERAKPALRRKSAPAPGTRTPRKMKKYCIRNAPVDQLVALWRANCNEDIVGVPDSGFAVATMPFNIVAIDFGGGVEACSTTISFMCSEKEWVRVPEEGEKCAVSMRDEALLVSSLDGSWSFEKPAGKMLEDIRSASAEVDACSNWPERSASLQKIAGAKVALARNTGSGWCFVQVSVIALRSLTSETALAAIVANGYIPIEELSVTDDSWRCREYSNGWVDSFLRE